MKSSAREIEAAPLLDLNTTPLIDVMLVLLILFIITIPLQSHAVKMDLPTGKPPVDVPLRTANLLVIARDGSLSWNGAALTRERLVDVVRHTGQMNPVPELHIRPDRDARYEDVDRVLALLKKEHVTKLGFVGNEAYAAI